MLTGRRVKAAEAERIGLADRLVPAGAAESTALEIAGTIAANSPVAVRAAKRALRNGWAAGLPAALDIEDAAWRTAALSADRREGIAAFNEKRAPQWLGDKSGWASKSGRESDRTWLTCPPRISLREVGPRDGLQNEDPVPTAAKVELINTLARTGVSRIEAVSYVTARGDPADGRRGPGVGMAITRAPAVRYSALAPNLRGARRALDAGFTEVEVVVSASDTHNRRNVNRGTAESLDDIAVIIDEAHGRGATCQVVVATAWGCPYEGDVPAGRVLSVAGRAVADGADSISFGDTTGMATPRRVTELVGGFRSRHPDVPLNLHFHNTRGTGLANVLAALELGVDDFDASVGGLGGCPYAPGASGNIATEELVYMVEDMGVATGVDLAAMIGAAEEAERIVGRQLPSQVLRAGPRTRTVAQ